MSDTAIPISVPLSERTGALPYTLKNDYLFKLVMQENKKVLCSFLCALLGIKKKEILSIDIKNPIHIGTVVGDKQMVLDLKLILNHAGIINLELQILNKGNWVERSIVYICRCFDSMESGDDYASVMSAHHIGILNLNQLNRATEKDKRAGLDLWARLFQATTWEELKMLAKEDKIFASAANTMNDFLQEHFAKIELRQRAELYALDQKRDAMIADQADKLSEQAKEIEALKAQLAELQKV